MTEGELAKLKPTTIEQIKKRFQDKESFNPGLYLRSLWIRSSTVNPVTTVTPLGLLHKMFSLDAWYPQKQVINITITLADSRTFMITKDKLTYKMVPISARLKNTYGLFLSSLREK